MIPKEFSCAFQPFQLITLYDMILFQLDSFLMDYRELNRVINLLDEEIKYEQELIREGEDVRISPSLISSAKSILERLQSHSDRLKMQRTSERLEIFEYHIQNHISQELKVSELKQELIELTYSIIKDLEEKLFVYIPKDNAEYYNQVDLFGIAHKFPEANKEITSAGNCYATGNYTACVFHLMRTVEYGLRYIADELNVQFSNNFKPKQWGDIIGAIETETKKIIQQPNSAQKDKDLVFYNHVATQFAFFKDAWRNQVMHTHSSYDQHQATSIMIHVKELMQNIANRGFAPKA